MSNTERSGLRIAYDRRGPSSGPTLLCLPGWCVSRGVFTRLVDRLAERHSVVALDWRAQGDSAAASGDFGEAELVADALAVIEETRSEHVIPIAQAHAGWVALALRRRLGARVPAIVATSWIVGDPPPPFLGALEALQDEAHWQPTRDKLFDLWLADAPLEVDRWIRSDMGRADGATWARGSREIAAAYQREGSPLAAFAKEGSPPHVLHVYSQPKLSEVLAAQEAFARDHAWFAVKRTDGASHFPTLETPDACAAAIETWLAAVLAR